MPKHTFKPTSIRVSESLRDLIREAYPHAKQRYPELSFQAFIRKAMLLSFDHMQRGAAAASHDVDWLPLREKPAKTFRITTTSEIETSLHKALLQHIKEEIYLTRSDVIRRALCGVSQKIIRAAGQLENPSEE